MKFSDLFFFSVDNLKRRKGRTVLTVIGVVIGVCAIIVMISLGVAANRATDEMLKNWGDLTKITVQRWGAQQGTPDLDDETVGRFREIPGVTAATPLAAAEFYGMLVTGPNDRYITEWMQITGLDPDAVEPMGYTLITGNYEISSSGANRIPVLVGSQFAFNFRDSRRSLNSPDAMKYPQYDESYMHIENLPQYDEDGTLLNPDDLFFDIMRSKLTYRLVYGYDETSGKELYREYEFVPVGMISEQNDYMIDGSVMMSIENMKKLQKDYARLSGDSRGGDYGMSFSYGGDGDGTVTVGGYENVVVKADDVRNMDEIEKAIKSEGYQIWSITETRRQMQKQVAQMQLMLGGLAAVSLFVAALNIMNTMTMAITERTREIGVMKVLGCELKNIRRMFLVESGMIGLVGGIAGVVVSFLLSFLLNNLTTLLALVGEGDNVDIGGLFGFGGFGEMMPGMQLSVIPPWLILLALVFAAAVGVLSGIVPANRAVKISSLEAIRHE
ncbi:MAG: ABC transporter permease [Clostridiales Family XIII bacterium]|jgi:ABC-type antimicrobial peptide transport system permease subunit|nr:ABC transporter permease [Clostridiales Family XIII bacterium]